MSAKPTERQIRAALVAKATQAPAPTSGTLPGTLRDDLDELSEWREGRRTLPAPTSGNTSAEQQARDMLERMDIEGAQNFSAGELVELANLIADRHRIPTSSNEEVEAMCERLEGAFNQLPVIEQAVAILRKQAAENVRLEARHEDDVAIMSKQAADIANLEADLGNERAINEARGKLTEELSKRIAKLQKLLRACLTDEFGVGSKALIKEIKAAIAKEGK